MVEEVSGSGAGCARGGWSDDRESAGGGIEAEAVESIGALVGNDDVTPGRVEPHLVRLGTLLVGGQWPGRAGEGEHLRPLQTPIVGAGEHRHGAGRVVRDHEVPFVRRQCEVHRVQPAGLIPAGFGEPTIVLVDAERRDGRTVAVGRIQGAAGLVGHQE